MLKTRKCLIIIKNRKWLYVEKNGLNYAFSCFPYESKSKAKKTIEDKFDIKNNPHKEYFSLEFWRTFEYNNYACDTKETYYCYILDLSQSLYIFRNDNYVGINIDEIHPHEFCDEHRKIYEFYRAVPDLENLNEDKLYGQVYYENEQFRISLINQRLLEMELDSIERDESFPLYFFEFSSTTTTFISERFINDKEKQGKIYRIEFFSGEDKTELYTNQNYLRISDIDVSVEGRIMFSASPIIGRNRNSIVIRPIKDDASDKKVIEQYQRLLELWETKIYTRTIRDRSAIIRRLNNMYSTIKPDEIKVRIFNVGQANCCLCDLQKRKLFFDIGVTYREKIKSNQSINMAVNTLIPAESADDVFVSHWDLDHILGVVYNKKILKRKRWLGPDFKKLFEKQGRDVSMSVINLIYYLIFVGKSDVMLIDTFSSDKTLYESDSLSIYLGEPRPTRINVLNNGGIIMKLQNKENMLFPGDCDNDVIPNYEINDTFDNIIVPHHGSLMGDPVIKGKKQSGNRAFICIGNQTGNFSEDSGIEKKYNDQGFDSIKRTRDLSTGSYYYEVLL